MKKGEYTIPEIQKYLEDKADFLQAIHCTIKRENKLELCIKFKPMDRRDIRSYFAVPFPKLLKEQKDKILVATR